MDWIRAAIKDVPGYPRDGVVFRDISPVLTDGSLFQQVVETMAIPWRGQRVAKVVGIESRGWLFAAPLANALGAGLVLVRRFGTLPRRMVQVAYDDGGTVSMHADAIAPGENVLLVDDLLATGVTAAATRDLVQQVKGEVVGYQFLVELSWLGGAAKLEPSKVNALVRYTS
jgi:adenine phosphoribosyltransferase